MRLSLLFPFVCASSILAGCTSLPTPNYVKEPTPNGLTKDVPAPTVDGLLRHIACELKSVAPEGSWLADNNYVVQVTLTLKVEDNGGATPALSFLTPISSFAFAVDGNLNLDRQRTFTTGYTVDLSTLSTDKAIEACGTSETYNLSGDLGIPAIVDGGHAAFAMRDINTLRAEATKSNVTVDVHATIEDKQIKPPVTISATATTDKASGSSSKKLPSPPTFGSTVQFMLVESFDTGPSWALKFFKGPSGSSKGILNGARTTTDTLILAFAPADVSPSTKTNLTATNASIANQAVAEDASAKAVAAANAQTQLI